MTHRFCGFLLLLEPGWGCGCGAGCRAGGGSAFRCCHVFCCHSLSLIHDENQNINDVF